MSEEVDCGKVGRECADCGEPVLPVGAEDGAVCPLCEMFPTATHGQYRVTEECIMCGQPMGEEHGSFHHACWEREAYESERRLGAINN